MVRAWFAGIAAILLIATGCRMCANPYDECGPVHSGRCGASCGTSCHPAPRAGSILSGQTTASPDFAEVPQESIISVRDGRVAPERQPTLAPAPSNHTTSKSGWRAGAPPQRPAAPAPAPAQW